MNFFHEHRIKIEKIAVIVLFFVSVYFFCNVLFAFIAPFIIGYLIALFLEPCVKMLIKYLRFSRSVSAVISILLMIFIIGGSLFLIFSQIFSQLKEFLLNDPMYYIELIRVSFDRVIQHIPNLFFYIPAESREMVNEVLNSILGAILGYLAEQLKYFSLEFIKFIPKFFVYLGIGILSSFFFIKDKLLINNLYRNNVPDVVKHNLTNIKLGLSEAFLGYIKSQSIIMCITGTICFIGLMIIGNEYALLVGFCVAIVDVLPLFGSGFILWPLSLVSFLTNDIRTCVGALIIYLTIQVTRQIVEPKILGSQIGLHPLITLMSVYVGMIVFGVLGIILGPMSVVIIKTIWNTKVIK